MHIDKIEHKLITILQSSINESKKYWVIAASLDHHNNIISIGENSYQKTHPIMAKLAIRTGNRTREYLHAEIASLVKNRQKPESIIVIRITSTGLIRMARPCNICNLALREAGIKYIYFSGDDGLIHLEEIHY